MVSTIASLLNYSHSIPLWFLKGYSWKLAIKWIELTKVACEHGCLLKNRYNDRQSSIERFKSITDVTH